MDKSHTDFYEECRAELAQLKARIEALELRLEAWENLPEPAPLPEEEVDFTDVEIGVDDKSFPTDAPQEDLPPAPEEDLPPVTEVPPSVIPEEAKNLPPRAETPAAPLPPDPETASLPWRTDKPGLPVKNIRSGISLLDRALFIGTLFKEDYALYDQTISRLNECGNLEEAVRYIRENFPQWNMRSDVVYHFMMAIRKKLG